MTILNITTGAPLQSPWYYTYTPSPLFTFVNAADAPGDAAGSPALTWVTGNYTALAGVFNATSGQFDGGNSTLDVNVTACTLGHQLYAVCMLSSPGGMAVLRAGGPGAGPTLVWDDFVGPLFIADDVGPNGALVVDTDYGGYFGGTLVACDLATGAELWAFPKPANATISAWAYNGAGMLMMKSYFDAGAQFSVRFDTFRLNVTGLALVSSASAPAFPPPAGEDSMTFDASGASSVAPKIPPKLIVPKPMAPTLRLPSRLCSIPASPCRGAAGKRGPIRSSSESDLRAAGAAPRLGGACSPASVAHPRCGSFALRHMMNSPERTIMAEPISIEPVRRSPKSRTPRATPKINRT